MNARRFERSNARIEVVPVPGGIHDLHLQYPDAVAGMVRRFLATMPAEASAALRIRADAPGRIFD
jgi:hypothetical protein